MSETRVFIASTIKDLTKERDEVGNFINGCGHKAEQWERGSILHNPVKFDLGGAVSSAVRAVSEADIAIVIIGREYGFRPPNANGLSATECEYDSAREKAVPIYVFVDAPVYEEHKRRLKGDASRGPANLADEEVYRFIDKVEQDQAVGIALAFPFKSASDIIACLRYQWSALFGQYLREKRKCSTCSGRMLREVELRARRGANKIEATQLFAYVKEVAKGMGAAEIDAYIYAQCVAKSTSFESFCREVSHALGREFRIDRLLRGEALREYERARQILATP